MQTVAPVKLPESQLFTELQSISDSIQAAIASQKQEAKYSLKAQEHVKKKLRIYLQCEHYNQPNGKDTDPRGMNVPFSMQSLASTSSCPTVHHKIEQSRQ